MANVAVRNFIILLLKERVFTRAGKPDAVFAQINAFDIEPFRHLGRRTVCDPGRGVGTLAMTAL
jgi:hypothetical protein